jgi:hypothetical protein
MTTKCKNLSRPAYLVLAVLALAAASACTNVHGEPQDGTETGNPPVIDAARVMLVVGVDSVRITGSAGAVSVGGAELHVQSSLTGAVHKARAKSDGSFDIQIDGSLTDIFELRAADAAGNSERASPVYVARGAAAVTGGAQGLTCKQRENLALSQMSAVAQTADTYCNSDADCAREQTSSVCNDACSDVPVSTLGATQIREARSAIESGICRDFSADGCNFIIFPCPAPLPNTLRCVANVCSLAPAPLRPAAIPGCSEEFEVGPTNAAFRVYWFSPEAQTCLPRTYGGSGGNANRYETLAACQAACGSAPRACEAPRVETLDGCIEREPGGVCLRQGTFCALPCSNASECVDDPVGDNCTGYCGVMGN